MNYFYRLCASQTASPHGYEIGYWPAGADLNDPGQFVVVENCWGQVEAATRTNLYLIGILAPASKAGGKT